jgi:hypothetical protein
MSCSYKARWWSSGKEGSLPEATEIAISVHYASAAGDVKADHTVLHT